MVNFNPHNKKMLWAIIIVIVLIIICVFIISFFSHSSKSYYEPISEQNRGFIGKADALFDKLLNENTIDSIDARSLSDLNRKYPAFFFDIPDSLNQDINIQDIRLVGINESLLKDKKDITFYESSDLRNLFKQQRLNKDKAYFKVSIKKEKGNLYIKKIQMIRSLFKIKFSNQIWEGDILGQFNNPINDENSRYFIYGSSVLPIRLQNYQLNTNNDMSNYPVYLLDDKIHGKGIFKKIDNKFVNFDLYEHYNKHYCDSSECFELKFDTLEHDNNHFMSLQVLKNKLIFDLDQRLTVTCITKQNQQKLISGSGAKEGRRIFNYAPDSENIRIIIENENGLKLAEFHIAKHNPLKKLSYIIETNKGKTRKQIDSKYTDVFTQQVVLNFLKNINEQDTQSVISLSIDPYLSCALEKELENYGNTFIPENGLTNNEHFEISICVINTATGEVLAAPYYNYTPLPLSQERKISKRNPNMTRRYIGSCFKPLMALASTQLYPELLNLTTGIHSGRTQAPIATGETYIKNHITYNYYNTEILGCPFYHTFSTTASNIQHYTKPINMETFLASSNDVFPVVLAMYSLTKFKNNDPLTQENTNLQNYISQNNNSSNISLLNPITNYQNNGILFANTMNAMDFDIHKSNFAKVLDNLYSIKSEAIFNTDFFDPEPARYLLRYFEDSIMISEISPDYTNMDYYSWNDSVKSFRSTVVPWVLGQGTNEWSPLKLAEAWARMVTKFPLRLSYIHNEHVSDIYNGSLLYQQTRKLLGDRSGNRETWNTFLDIFKAAQSNTSVDGSNTLIKVFDLIQSINTNQNRTGNNRLIVLGKTGTPDDYEQSDWQHFDISGKIIYDIGLYTFSIMTEGQYQSLKNNITIPSRTIPNAGITAVIRIVHAYPVGITPLLITRIIARNQISHNIDSNNARNFISNDNQVLGKIIFYNDRLFK